MLERVCLRLIHVQRVYGFDSLGTFSRDGHMLNLSAEDFHLIGNVAWRNEFYKEALVWLKMALKPDQQYFYSKGNNHYVCYITHKHCLVGLAK